MSNIEFDPDLTGHELKIVAKLTETQLKEIDEMLLSNVHPKFKRKLAYIVAKTMGELPNRVSGLSDVFYAQRVAILVDQGVLEADGNLKAMRYCEVGYPNRAGI